MPVCSSRILSLVANEGRQEKKIMNMEHLSFDAGERMAQFGGPPVQ